MTFLKYTALLSLLLLIASSCAKENLTEITDEIPEIIPTETIAEEINIGLAKISAVNASILITVDSSGNNVSYFLQINAEDLTIAGGLFLTSWKPAVPEPAIQNIVYTGSQVLTISQSAIDAIAADPDDLSMIDFTDIRGYDGANLNIKISNATDTNADLTLSGSIQDFDGNDIPISGFFNADLQ